MKPAYFTRFQGIETRPRISFVSLFEKTKHNPIAREKSRLHGCYSIFLNDNYFPIPSFKPFFAGFEASVFDVACEGAHFLSLTLPHISSYISINLPYYGKESFTNEVFTYYAPLRLSHRLDWCELFLQLKDISFHLLRVSVDLLHQKFSMWATGNQAFKFEAARRFSCKYIEDVQSLTLILWFFYCC